jgi:signal transduction histidine kinase
VTDSLWNSQSVKHVLSVLATLSQPIKGEHVLADYMAFVHTQLAQVMSVNSFFLVLYSRHEQQIHFPFNIDQYDEPIDPDRRFTISNDQQSPTAWVVLNQKKLLISAKENRFNNQASTLWASRSKANQWFGVPLIDGDNQCHGALVIQEYDKSFFYSKEQQQFFEHVAHLISNIIIGFELDKTLISTGEYTDLLSNELANYKRDKKIEHALFKISSIRNIDSNLSHFFQQVHYIIDKIMYAKNFFIALYDEEEQIITLSYFVDKREPSNIKNKKIPLGEGLSSYVIKSRKAQLLDKEKITTLIEQGKVREVLGAHDFTSWMAAPLISTNVLHGIMVIQSYDPKIIYTEEDLKLLDFFAKHIAKAIESTVNSIQRKESQLKLATQHRLLEQKNLDLNQLVLKLQSTQTELIQQEKMAALGGLVAGIAHEINTPLGICVTGISHLQEEYKLINHAIETNELTESELTSFFDDMNEVLIILETNIHRGAELINSFKQVAVDQSSNELRTINLNQYINSVILSLKPRLKHSKASIKVECDENISLDVDAGAVSQIISNLLINSIKHGFNEINEGKVLIEAYKKKKNIIIRYRDDGIGMDEEALKQLFDPFYTTKRGEGGSGLGTHVVYNLVTTSLKGKINVQSKVGKGLAYLIKFPIKS